MPQRAVSPLLSALHATACRVAAALNPACHRMQGRRCSQPSMPQRAVSTLLSTQHVTACRVAAALNPACHRIQGRRLPWRLFRIPAGRRPTGIEGSPRRPPPCVLQHAGPASHPALHSVSRRVDEISHHAFRGMQGRCPSQRSSRKTAGRQPVYIEEASRRPSPVRCSMQGQYHAPYCIPWHAGLLWSYAYARGSLPRIRL